MEQSEQSNFVTLLFLIGMNPVCVYCWMHMLKTLEQSPLLLKLRNLLYQHLADAIIKVEELENFPRVLKVLNRMLTSFESKFYTVRGL